MRKAWYPVALTGLFMVACGDDTGIGGFGGTGDTTSSSSSSKATSSSSKSSSVATTTNNTTATTVASTADTTATTDVSTTATTDASSSATTDASSSATTTASSTASTAASSSTGMMGVCGDSVVDAGEQCDDGNGAADDCCDANCQAEAGCETEVNNTDPVADALSTHAINDVVEGNIFPVGDVDFFSFTVPAGDDYDVVLETLAGPLGTACAQATNMFGIDTEITVYDSTLTEIDSDDDGSPDGFCSLLELTLSPGDYFVDVHASPTSGMINNAFDYALSVTMTVDVPPVCGDGNVDPGEQCDDGNVVSGDGCSATCTTECPGVGESEPNDTAAEADGPIADGLQNCAAVTPANDNDFWSFTVAAGSAITLETFDGTGAGCVSGTDTEIFLVAPDGTTQLAEEDYSSTGTCSLLTSDTNAALRNLAAGTYFVRVHEFGENLAIASYRIQLTVDAICGDALVEGPEECDGTPNCNPDCTLVAACGNGVIDAGELCDDGNTVNGDGCSSTCQIEGTTAEVEGNDTQALADGNTVQISGNTLITGSITEGSDELDVFRVTLAAPTVLRFETFTSPGDCNTSAMALRVRDSAFTSLYADVDTKGIRSCSALTLNLPAGTFYVSVEESGTNASLPLYFLQVAVQGQAGTEAEAAGTTGTNETSATAETQLGAQTNVYVLGDHTVNAPGGMAGISDRDFYAITVPAGASIRAEIIEGDTDLNKTCESNNLDSEISLFAPDGTTSLVNDDDAGRGFCSLFDGTGSTNVLNANAHNLAAGTYFIEVRESDGATLPDDVFVYRLVVTVRTP